MHMFVNNIPYMLTLIMDQSKDVIDMPVIYHGIVINNPNCDVTGMHM